MRVVCAGNCSRKSCGSLLLSRWIASKTTRCSASCQIWFESSRIKDVCRALALPRTQSAHKVARSSSNTRVAGLCFGMGFCAGNNTHCTAVVVLRGGINDRFGLGGNGRQQKNRRGSEKSRADFSRNQVRKLEMFGSLMPRWRRPAEQSRCDR